MANVSTPWHRASFDRFVNERLPQLIAARMPLGGYEVEPAGCGTCRVKITLAVADAGASSSRDGEVRIEQDLPQPDEDGVFAVDGQRRVVLPVASSEELDLAEIRCVGEQLYDYIAARLGEAPAGLPWDEALARAWLPLEAWVREFLASAFPLEDTNWLSRHTLLRRLAILERKQVIAAGQFGRTCPFETPEGPNIGRILTIAVGAEIRDGKLVVVDERPEAALGLSASMIPFIEHNDPNRILMGANMLRQWLVPPDPEPALVQTGNEPAAPDFWCGRNLLTAFISWGGDTFEDSIVISESCARRLGGGRPVEPGDKLSNRHGTKGVVGRILPDAEMPHLADGTPVELVYSFIGLHSRMTFGQVREALMGRIARAGGGPAVVPPFHAPSERELRERLRRAGLPEDGMETLRLGRGGKTLARPSTVGWVYWGRTMHLARDKMTASVSGEGGMRQGELEYDALRDAGAFENLREELNTRSSERADADTLAARVATGTVEQAGPPTPEFLQLTRRLAAAGIRAQLQGSGLSLSFAPPEGAVLELASPVSHPWLGERRLTEVGAWDDLAEYHALAKANGRLQHMLGSGAPAALVEQAAAQLRERVRDFFEALLTPAHLRMDGRVLFSGRAVLAPGPDLHLDQVGLPEEMAWTLFGPLVARELGDACAASRRDGEALRALEEVMSGSWVIINRAPSLAPTAFLAFHPVRVAEPVIRLHPLACMLLNADFDGDQAAVFLPVTEAGQREAGERLSLAGHIARDLELLAAPLSGHPVMGHPLLTLNHSYPLLPTQESIWGLAALSLTLEGRREIAALTGGAAVASPVTRAWLAEATRRLVERDGVERTLTALERLTERGFEVAKESGASLSPFAGASLSRAAEPESDEPKVWEAYAEQVAEQVASCEDLAGSDLGPQLLAIRSGARGSVRQLALLVGPQGVLHDVNGQPVIVRHSLREGLTPKEMYAKAVGAREALAQVVFEIEDLERSVCEQARARSLHVMARAMRARRPGIVFARAAASGEVDPLVDVDSRLFVGLPAVPAAEDGRGPAEAAINT